MNLITKKVVAGVFALAVLVSPVSCLAQNAPELSLNQAVSLALENSHELALARAKYATAKNEARVDRSPFLPDLSTGSNPAYSNGFPESLAGQPPAVFQLTYSEAIFNKPLNEKVHAQEEHAKGLEAEIARTRDDVIVSTATAYLELAKARHSLDLLRNESASAKAILDYTRDRANAGMELPIEVTRSELTEARIEQQIAQTNGRVQILTDRLRHLTGLPQERLEGNLSETMPAGAAPEEDPVKNTVEINPILKAMEFERSARVDLLKGARGGYWPTVDLVSQYNVLAKFNNYQNYFTSFQRNNVGIALLIHIPLFNFKTPAEVALAKSQITEADLNLENLRDSTESAEKQYRINAADQKAAVNVARLELKLAQENLALVQSRFDQNQASVKDLEQARLAEGDKWLSFLNADFLREQADLALLQATGQLAQVFK